jgi:hypothetical protein
MKVLFYDIETAPNLAYVWGHYEQNVVKHSREWYIMCFSYKWLNQATSKALALPDFEEAYTKDPEDDKGLVTRLWELMDEADVVVAHNGDRFDMRKANARFIAHGLGPPSPVIQIDTLKVARRYFMFNSNRLGDLGEHLQLGSKEATGGFKLWEGCMRGDLKSWGIMKRYARQDTDLLEAIYLAMRPFMKNHPSFNMLSDLPDGCPVCAAEETLIRRGTRHTKTCIYQQWQCTECGSYSRSRVSDPEQVGSRPVRVS